MKYRLIATLPIMIVLTGCGATAAKYQPVVDRPNAHYVTDLGECQQLAETRSYTNDDVKTSAVAGAVIGTVLFGFDSWGDTLGGAAIGSALGAGSRAWDTRDERKQIVVECLRGRGHNIAG